MIEMRERRERREMRDGREGWEMKEYLPTFPACLAFRAFLAFLAFLACLALPAHAAVAPESAPPGATVALSGKGFGAFKSTRENQVLFNGAPALIQRWEPALVEVKVPLRAKDGPVEVVRGAKRIKVGTFTVQRPTIESLSPTETEPGAVVQVIGRHFGNTAGPKDPNTMFGVNDVQINGVTAKVRRWRDDRIEVEVPGNAQTGDLLIRLASSDPLPDGSCCAPVEYAVSNALALKVLPAIRVDPDSGPVGTKVVLFGKGFGAARGTGDAVLIAGRPATVAKWEDTVIVVHVPLNAETGPLVLRRSGAERSLGTFTVRAPKVTGIKPASAPIGSLLRISGENFGFYSESGDTEFAFTDFDKGENGVEIGGVPAIVHRWHDDKIDVWVPYSAKSGPVVIKRGGSIPNPDGSCCAEKRVVTIEAGAFTRLEPEILSYEPTAAGVDEIVTIKGRNLGNFVKTSEATQSGLNEGAHDREPIKLGQNVARSEVLFNGIAAMVLSWTDTEIKARVPRRHLYGIGGAGTFEPDMSTGPLVVRRGSWDLNPDGSCCTAKQWVTMVAGEFTIEAKGLADPGYFNNPDPTRD
jgi:hypothetical protein